MKVYLIIYWNIFSDTYINKNIYIYIQKLIFNIFQRYIYKTLRRCNSMCIYFFIVFLSLEGSEITETCALFSISMNDFI